MLTFRGNICDVVMCLRSWATLCLADHLWDSSWKGVVISNPIETEIWSQSWRRDALGRILLHLPILLPLRGVSCVVPRVICVPRWKDVMVRGELMNEGLSLKYQQFDSAIKYLWLRFSCNLALCWNNNPIQLSLENDELLEHHYSNWRPL
jgi:hypothetical protein